MKHCKMRMLIYKIAVCILNRNHLEESVAKKKKRSFEILLLNLLPVLVLFDLCVKFNICV